MKHYQCPVCFYPDMEDPPRDFNICSCCGTEFGNDDYLSSYEELRAAWVENAMPWFYGDPPPGWSGERQLAAGMKKQVGLEATA